MVKKAEEQIGVITHIQFFSLNDGPGIRTTVFLKGCRLDCKWCHNPEGKRHYPEVFPYIPNCTGCKACLDVCPTGALTFAEHLRMDKGKCIVCKQCVEECQNDGIVLWGRLVTVKEVIEEVEKDKAFYKNSGGGMTLSGGEPLAQPEFTFALLKCARERGIGTALDTCGYVRWEVLEPILEWVDLVLLDLKNMDPGAHKEFTGVTNELILANARKIAEKGIKMRIRVPIIPGRNDSEDNLRKTAEFVEQLNRNNVIEGVDLLPYHPYAGAKYRIFGIGFPYPQGEGYPEEKLLSMVEIFCDHDLEVTVGG